ncbi:MAG: peptidylprolyl isomerase, partial [Bacteroidales bacterium]|nr:peptidylprolyl isomerase [Bacteroidales bacterium]
MNMKKLLLAALIIAGLTCSAQQKQEKETVVVIKTTMGTMKAKLYNDTPLHRDNFIKLVNEGWYNG